MSSYTGPSVEGDINEEELWRGLHEKMSDLAKHTPNLEWSAAMMKIAEGAFELAALHANQPSMEDDWPMGSP